MIERKPHGLGRLARVEMRDFTKTFSYDALGNAIKEDYTIAGRTLTTEREFDMKRRLKVFSSLGERYNYTYEGGLLRRISDGGNIVLDVSGVSLGGLPTEFGISDFGTVKLKYSLPADP